MVVIMLRPHSLLDSTVPCRTVPDRTAPHRTAQTEPPSLFHRQQCPSAPGVNVRRKKRGKQPAAENDNEPRHAPRLWLQRLTKLAVRCPPSSQTLERTQVGSQRAKSPSSALFNVTCCSLNVNLVNVSYVAMQSSGGLRRFKKDPAKR